MSKQLEQLAETIAKDKISFWDVLALFDQEAIIAFGIAMYHKSPALSREYVEGLLKEQRAICADIAEVVLPSHPHLHGTKNVNLNAIHFALSPSIDLIHLSQEGMKWVKADEHLPTKEGEYLVYSDDYEYVATAYWDGASFGDKDPVDGEFNLTEYGDSVTHWMPLPLSPTTEPTHIPDVKEEAGEKVIVKFNEGLRTINGLRVTFETKEIRSEIEAIKCDFVLPAHYTFKIMPSGFDGQVAKICSAIPQPTPTDKDREIESLKNQVAKLKEVADSRLKVMYRDEKTINELREQLKDQSPVSREEIEPTFHEIRAAASMEFNARYKSTDGMAWHYWKFAFHAGANYILNHRTP